MSTAKRNTLQHKLVFSSTVFVMVVLLITLLSYFYVFHLEFKQLFQQRLISLAKVAALSINVEQHQRLRTKEDESTAEYRKMRSYLQAFIKENPDVRYIYTMRKTATENIWEFVLDTENSHIGDKYNISGFGQMQQAFYGPITDKDFETDSWGTFLSGYAPIVDKSGKAVAIIGLDMAATTLVGYETQLLFVACIIYLIFAALTLSITYKGIGRIISPITEIIQGINEVQRGNLSHRISFKSNDELGDIANAINHTAKITATYQEMLERELETTKNQRKEIFKVYSDVVYSVSQGRFSLVDLETASLLEEEGNLCTEIKLLYPLDVKGARDAAKEFLQARGFSVQRISQITLCVSEAVTNTLKHAQGGELKILWLNDTVRFIINDTGQGMQFDKLPHMIFLGGFSTKVSMGYGFTILNKYADQIHLSTSSHGTFLALDFKDRQDKMTAC